MHDVTSEFLNMELNNFQHGITHEHTVWVVILN